MLTDTAIRAAKPREKSYKLFDALGLYLEVAPTGSKLWRLKYRHDGRENRLAPGRASRHIIETSARAPRRSAPATRCRRRSEQPAAGREAGDREYVRSGRARMAGA